MILIAEYVLWKQPEVARQIWAAIKRAQILSLSFDEWKRLMEEPPLPGRAGVLREEVVAGEVWQL